MYDRQGMEHCAQNTRCSKIVALINKAAHFADGYAETPRIKMASSRSYRRLLVELVEGPGPCLPPSLYPSLPPCIGVLRTTQAKYYVIT